MFVCLTGERGNATGGDSMGTSEIDTEDELDAVRRVSQHIIHIFASWVLSKVKRCILFNSFKIPDLKLCFSFSHFAFSILIQFRIC